MSDLDKLTKQNEILPIRIWNDENINEDTEIISAKQILITLLK